MVSAEMKIAIMTGLLAKRDMYIDSSQKLFNANV